MKSNKLGIISVMFCFFCMGFVDLVGIASNYVKEDLQLTDSVANIFPSLVFFWFLIFSVPTGVLMNKIGRKNTVVLSLVVTAVSLLLPLFGETFSIMLTAFSLLGIGNALMQTSLNPLVTCVIAPPPCPAPGRGENGGSSSQTGRVSSPPSGRGQGGKASLASTLTFGQFIKAIASFIAPYLAMWGATAVIPTLGLDWRILFAIFLIVGIIATAVLASIQIEESPLPTSPGGGDGKNVQPSVFTQFINAFKLLSPSGGAGGGLVLLSFLGIMCHVGIDVGTNTTAPKILMERLGMTLNDAAFATSLYFIGRTIGCFTGSFFLRVLKTRTFFIISCLCMAISMLCFLLPANSLLLGGDGGGLLYVGIFLVGYGNSNIFSMCFANALQAVPEKQNEVSGLMIMGLFGGTLFPLAMGVASDAMGQAGAVLCMAVGVLYLFSYIPKVK